MTLNPIGGRGPHAFLSMAVVVLTACGGGDAVPEAPGIAPASAGATVPDAVTVDGGSPAAGDIGERLAALPAVLSGDVLFGSSTPRERTAAAAAGESMSATTTTWTRIAGENSSFTTSSARIVRYGAGTAWVSRTVSGAGQCSNSFFGSDPAVGVTKSCEVQTTTTDPAVEWTRIAVEGGSFRTASLRTVRYGTGTRWTSRDVVGDGRCTNAFFGSDPAIGSAKVCEVSSAPSASGAGTGSGSTVTAADMLLKVATSDAFSAGDWDAHCDGFKGASTQLPESGRWGPAYKAPGSVLKLGRATVPDGAGRQGLLLRAQPNNFYHGDSPRCELYFNDPSDVLPRGKTFYHAFSLWMGDWSAATDMMGISQWFHGLTGAGLNPPFIMVANGNRLYGQVRYSQARPTMTSSDIVGVRVFDISSGFYKRWLNVVVQAKVTPYFNEGGFMKIWINGQLVADYKGPIGYAANGAQERVVHGVYPLIKGSTPFDLDVPIRDMYLGKSLVVVDPTGRFAPQDLVDALTP